MRAASSGDGKFRGGEYFHPETHVTDLSIILQKVDALHPLCLILLTTFWTLICTTFLLDTMRTSLPNEQKFFLDTH